MRRTEADLTEQERVAVVQRLACFEEPTAIRAALAQQGRHVTVAAIQRYASAPKWQALLQSTRAQYLARVADCPLAHKRRRIEELTALYLRARGWNELRLAKDLLEQVRLEVEGYQPTYHVDVAYTAPLSDQDLAERVAAATARVQQLQTLLGGPHDQARLPAPGPTGSHGGAV